MSNLDYDDDRPYSLEELAEIEEKRYMARLEACKAALVIAQANDDQERIEVLLDRIDNLERLLHI